MTCSPKKHQETHTAVRKHFALSIVAGFFSAYFPEFMPVVPLFSIGLRCSLLLGIRQLPSSPTLWCSFSGCTKGDVVWPGSGSDLVLATGPPLSASARTCQISSLSPARSGHLQVPAAKPDLRQDASSYSHRSYPAASSCAVGREDFPAFLTCGVCDLSQCPTGLFVSKTSSQVQFRSKTPLLKI